MPTLGSRTCESYFETWVLTSAFGAAIHIFTKLAVEEILNIQPKGSKCKPYQVKQVRQVIVRYKLSGETDGQA